MCRACVRGIGPRAGSVDDSAKLPNLKGLAEGYQAIMGFNMKHKGLEPKCLKDQNIVFDF